jgi:hypothetical protein
MEKEYKLPQTRQLILRDLKQKISISKTRYGYEVRYTDDLRGDYIKVLEIYKKVVIY